MSCIKTKMRFHYCGHDDEDEFSGCDKHEGPDVPHETKRECWESQSKKQRNLSTRMNTSYRSGGVCSRDCDAEFIGFYCCLCHKFIESTEIFRNSENSLVHMHGDVEHEFCDDCYTKNF